MAISIIKQDRGGTIEEHVCGDPQEVDAYIEKFKKDWEGYMPRLDWSTMDSGKSVVILSRWNTCD